ncbi:histone H3-K56 acetyltransferase, partial [Tribonema minus]
FIQANVNRRQQELNPDVQPDEVVYINVPSNMDTSFDMPPLYKAAFYPSVESSQVRYTSKTVCAYQMHDGQPVLVLVLFCQEYGIDTVEANKGRVYIAYLDTAAFLLPVKARSAVYKDVLAAYLEWVARRGFRYAHIWSCPPRPRVEYMFPCRPVQQLTLTSEQLLDWYLNMLEMRCMRVGISTR